jgi:CRISPR-associated protein Cas1
MKDYHILPKLRDSISYIYIEYAHINQDKASIILNLEDGKVPVPVAALTCLMLGPGTTITHEAIKTISTNGCLVVWCGEKGEKFYASGMGETRSGKNVLKQARLCMDEKQHLAVAKKMYERRFPKLPKGDYTLQQLRGMEGIRVREAYKLASKTTGVRWKGRNYKTKDWDASDPINRALSAANAILYSVCQAAIVSLGYSTALGFVHTGKMLSFVYDIADLYKADTTIPAAFEAVQRGTGSLEKRVRIRCRDYFQRVQLLKRIPLDIEWIFDIKGSEQADAEVTGDLWDQDDSTSAGGRNYASGETDGRDCD